MKIAWVLLALCLSACVTESGDALPLRPKPDLSAAARTNTQLGIEYFRQGQYQIAQEKLQRAIEQAPDSALAHGVQALVLEKLGDSTAAEREFKRAVALDGNDTGLLNNYGVFLCGAGRVDAAVAVFKRAAAAPSNRNPETTLTNAGVCLRKAGALGPAAEMLRDAIARNPEFPEALLQMAALSSDTKDDLRARAFLQRYERVAAPSSESLKIGVITERRLGDEQAALHYEAVLRQRFPEVKNSN